MSKVLTILAPGFEEIEAVTVIDLLRRAEIDVTVCGLNDVRVTGSHDITIECDLSFDDIAVDDFDCLFLPGGQPGTSNLKNDARVIQLVQKYDGGDAPDLVTFEKDFLVGMPFCQVHTNGQEVPAHFDYFRGREHIFLHCLAGPAPVGVEIQDHRPFLPDRIS